MPRPKPLTRRAPYAWDLVLHFANAEVTEKNWAAVLLRSQRAKPVQPTYGFDTADEVRPVLENFRALLASLVVLSPKDAERSDILEMINDRARAVLHRWIWYRGTGRVVPEIRTRDDSFEQSLYAQLALAMTVEPFTSIKQCRVCARFFYQPTRSAAPLCSSRCRTKDVRIRAAQYRMEHQDQYREYQRQLMATRRRKAK